MPEYEWEFQVLDDDPVRSELRLADLPDTCFWKSRLRNLFLHRELWASIEFADRGVYILSGPVGSGRHMTGSALIGELPAQYGTNASKTAFLQIRAEDFTEPLTAKEAVGRVYALFEVGTDVPLRVIVFDAMDQYVHLQAVSNAIADCVKTRDPEEGKLAVVCYAEDLSKLSFALRSMALILRTNLPSEQQRAEFLESCMSRNVPDPSHKGMVINTKLGFDDISIEELVAATEGFSYGDLSLFVRYAYLSSLDRAKTDIGVLILSCGRDAALECLDTVRQQIHRDIAPIIQLQQLVSENPQGGSAANGSMGNDLLDIARKKKNERTVEENLALIDQVVY